MKDLNTIAYSIYLLISFFITIQIGWICYKNGEVYLKQIFASKTAWVAPVNKILLTGYYLINLGYIAFSLSFWDHLTSIEMLISRLSFRLGYICLILAIIHCFNLWVLAYLAKKPIFSNKL